jgi:chromosome segregation ATPase
MLTRKSSSAVLLLFVSVMMLGTAAADDPNSRASREREMLRRAQEALRQSQVDNGELSRAKADAEQKLKDAGAQLESARNASKSAQSALKAQLQTASGSHAALSQQLEQSKLQIAQLTSRQKETATQLATRESELKRAQQELQLGKTANASCEAKNLKLYEYSDELVQRYQHKGVWAALSQKEPVFGIKEVGVENVVQEYQEKLAAQKINPAPPPPAAVAPTPAAPPAPAPMPAPPTSAAPAAQTAPH